MDGVPGIVSSSLHAEAGDKGRRVALICLDNFYRILNSKNEILSIMDNHPLVVVRRWYNISI